MNGRHVAPWVVYDAEAEVDTVFPPTRRTFAATQSHWFRMKDGRIVEHWANRDDLGMGQQLGWNPPTLLYLARMLLASRRARRR
jgi:predicted ester cyclase